MTDDRTTASQSGDQTHGTPRDGAGPAPPTSEGAAAGRPGDSGGRRAGTRPPLTSEDVRRLTLYKWRYSLESTGFTTDQVGHLLFLKWLYANCAVRG